MLAACSLLGLILGHSRTFPLPAGPITSCANRPIGCTGCKCEQPQQALAFAYDMKQLLQLNTHVRHTLQQVQMPVHCALD